MLSIKIKLIKQIPFFKDMGVSLAVYIELIIYKAFYFILYQCDLPSSRDYYSRYSFTVVTAFSIKAVGTVKLCSSVHPDQKVCSY